MHDVKSDIDAEMSKGEKSDGEGSDKNDYENYDAGSDGDEEAVASGAAAQRQSSGLETALMSPIRPTTQRQFDDLFDRSAGARLPSDDWLISSVTGGGMAPTVSLLQHTVGGSELSPQRELASFSGGLAPSHSTNNLLEQLQLQLGGKEARLKL